MMWSDLIDPFMAEALWQCGAQASKSFKELSFWKAFGAEELFLAYEKGSLSHQETARFETKMISDV